MEVILSISLFTIFVISILTLESSMYSIKSWSIRELKNISETDFGNISNTPFTRYGNDTKSYDMGDYKIFMSDYIESWGRNTCNIELDLENTYEYIDTGIDIGLGNMSTDAKIRNGFMYLTSDSSISSDNDLYIVDIRDKNNYKIISKLNTGPGVNALEVAGPYIYLAQASTVRQLQIIDIHNRELPILISQLKLPTSTATTTSPFAYSIFYSKGYIFLGTVKWNGAELSIIDVSNPHNPILLSVFETGTLINDIYVRENKLYLATSDMEQMQILDISNINNPVLISSFSPSGFSVQEGKVIDYFEDNMIFGRTVGGFNIISNHEIFDFGTSTDLSNYFSRDIKGGIYGILRRKGNIAILTHEFDHEFQIWDEKMKNVRGEFALKNNMKKMICDNNNLYFITGDNKAFTNLNYKI